MYQIALKMSSAKRFINAERLGKNVLDHTIYEFGGNVRSATVADRTVCPEDTLPLHCMANAVAVLSGDRPVPAKRSHSPLADYPEFAKYVEIARRAHVRIDTIDKNTSIMQTDKANMFSNGDVSVKQQKTSAKLRIDGVDHELNRACPTHDGIAMAWPREIYLEFDAVCKKVFGKDYKKDMNVLQTISQLRDKYVSGDADVCKFMDSIHYDIRKKTKGDSEIEIVVVKSVDGIDCSNLELCALGNDLVNPIKRGVVSGSIFRGETWARSAELKSWIAPVSTHGDPELAWVVSGVIYLKVTEEEAEAILNGPEVATILDGGMLTPIDPKTEGLEFASLREVVTRWDDANDALPTPFEG